MKKFFKGHFLHLFLFLLSTFAIYSCTTNRELIGKSPTEFGTIKFFMVRLPTDKAPVIKLYAEINSTDLKRYYSFYSNRIMMTDERVKNLSYTVLFKQLPDEFNSNAFQRFTKLDSLVFDKAKAFLVLSEYEHLKSFKGATGFEIEVHYLHEFPKNKRFQPL